MVALLSLAKPSHRFAPHRLSRWLADSVDEDSLLRRKYKPSRRPTFVEKESYEETMTETERKKSPLLLKKPKGVKTEVELDESGEFYRVNEKIGDVPYRDGSIMTFEQYKRYQTRNTIRNYYREKSKAADEKAAAKNDNPRALIPRVYINPNLDRIFGGNYIDVKLNGSVLLDFGYRIQTTNNPNLPINLRRIGGFFFDQQIAMNAQAKIGERLRITINQDTKSQFDFDNNVKVEYTSLETDIIQKIEAGNVNMPLNSQLIQGAQNLFGIKAQLQFGRLKVTAVAAQQRGRGQEVKLQGGAQGRDFNIRADNYENDRHYFLAHFFRDIYEPSLKTMPQITSGVTIERVEVWVTNRNNTIEGNRNVVALMDLGEQNPYNRAQIVPGRDRPASNFSNSLSEIFRDTSGANPIRRADNVANVLQSRYGLVNGNDFEIVRNARKLRDNEFKFHPQLGYISLNAAVSRDDVVGVSFVYRFRGVSYTVGELTSNYGNLNDKQVIFVKMLRPGIIRTNVPMWDLQMKNIYSLQATNISRENFQLRVVYRDDRTQLNSPVLTNVPPSSIDGQPLIQLLGLDNLNMSNDPQPDGNFDFVESSIANPVQPGNLFPGQTPNMGAQQAMNDPFMNQNQNTINQNNTLQQNHITAITIDPQFGRMIFPVLEPFGRTLKTQFGSDTITNPQVVDKYVYDELYRLTKADALQLSNKNKFFIVGRLQSSTTDEIPIGGFMGGQLREEAVIVTSGATTLNRGTDYIINPSGTVKILNPAYLMPGQTVTVRYEQPDLFQVRSKFFTGTRFDYVLNKDIAFGATLLNLSERPLVSRVAIGDEPVNNLAMGVDGTFRRDSRLITQIVDKLPFYSTKEKSNIQVQGEVARLHTSTPRFLRRDGDGGTFFLDDFESTSLPFRLDNSPQLNWRLAATPPGLEGVGYPSDPLANAYRRAKLAWYVIDQSFYRGENANGLNAADLSNYYVRAFFPQDLFPGRDRTAIQLNEPLFDIAYFPEERGPYNLNPNGFNPDGTLRNPESNWAGITRAVNNNDTDFDNANYQYLEFWMMDPFITGEKGRVIDGRRNENNTTGGKLIFNLGSVSEDVIKDGRHGFEQGLPINGNKVGNPEVDESPWGFVTNQPFLIDAFANEPGARANQDVGLDGMTDDEERQKFARFLDALRPNLNPTAFQRFQDDPAGDNFRFFISPEFNQTGAKLLERYKDYNNTQNNSPDNANAGAIIASSYTVPDNEDLNKNNTLNDLEEFFQYEMNFNPNNMQVGSNFIANAIDVDITDQNGNRTGETVKWYLIRIPLRESFTAFGGIRDFKSIRFLRMYLTGWRQPVVLRMAQMQLVASQWRPFLGDLSDKGLKTTLEPDDKVFTVATLNEEENSRTPTVPWKSPYTVPPGFQRDRDINSLVPRRLNEHALQLCVDGLADGDARAVFKNVGGLNLINFKRVKMFVHAEADPQITADDDLTVFIRFGSDFTDNYYEIERPLKLTNPALRSDPNEIWRADNAFDIDLEQLVELKLRRDRETGDLFGIFPAYRKTDMPMMYIRGNPAYTNIQTIMIGIRNPKSPDRQPKSLCVWVNELRVTGINAEDGWAAVGRASMKIADLGNVTATAKYTGAGYGSLEQKVSQRLQENTTELGVSVNMQVDKLIPKNEKIGIRLPMNTTYDRKIIDPKYDPGNPDVLLNRSVENRNIIEPGSGDNYEKLVQDQTTRRSINFTNISKVKVKPNARRYIFDIENFSVNLGYSDIQRSNVNIESYESKNYRGGVGWAYAPRPPTIEPFKKAGGIFKSNYLKLIKDINLNPMPSNITIRGDLDRTITRTQFSNGIFNGQHDIFGIQPNWEKRFLFNRNYALGWNITKSIQFNYNAIVNAIVDEPAGQINGAPELRPGFTRRDSIVYNLRQGGRMKNFNQQIGVNYKLPLDKFPATNWTSLDARYAAGYTWTAAPFRPNDTLPLGNVNQNNRDFSINARFDLVKFYNKVKFLQNINNARPPGQTPPKPPANAPKDTSKTKEKKKPEFKVAKSGLRFLMMVRSVNATYQQTEGTVLPGYLGSPKYFGLDDSRNDGALYDAYLPFILGDQRESIYKNEAFAHQYLSRNELLTDRITKNYVQNITGRANLEPFKEFRIQLDAKVSNSLSFQEQYAPVYDTATREFLGFESRGAFRTGTYSVSFITIQTFFEQGGGKGMNSPTFSQFEANRFEIWNRLETENPLTASSGFRYDTNSQDVLVPAFIAAYTGKSPKSVDLTAFPRIPLPNWRVDYAGLVNTFPALKAIFASVNITHGYSSNYSVQSFRSREVYGRDTLRIQNFWNVYFPTATDSAGVYVPINEITSVSIIERFAPLLGINVKLKSNLTFRAEYRTDRNLNMNVTARGNVTEMRSEDFTFGTGYTKPNMKLPFKWQGREVVLKNDVTIRLDITRRESTTYQRRLDFPAIASAGQVNFNIRPNVSYQVNQRLTTQGYFEYTYSRPKISTGFPRSTVAFGIQVRFSLS